MLEKHMRKVEAKTTNQKIWSLETIRNDNCEFAGAIAAAERVPADCFPFRRIFRVAAENGQLVTTSNYTSLHF